MTAPVRISFSVEGVVEIDRVFAGIEARMTDLRPAWAGVVQAFQTIVAAAFASEGKSTGAAWKPLAASTQADRKRQGFPPAHPILERTGTLKRALTVGDGAHVVSRPQLMQYHLEPEIAQVFAYHQSNRPRTRLPRRAPVLLTADNKTAIVHPIRLYLTGRDGATSRRGTTRRAEWRDPGADR
jgi:hypothetical protein